MAFIQFNIIAHEPITLSYSKTYPFTSVAQFAKHMHAITQLIKCLISKQNHMINKDKLNGTI